MVLVRLADTNADTDRACAPATRDTTVFSFSPGRVSTNSPSRAPASHSICASPRYPSIAEVSSLGHGDHRRRTPASEPLGDGVSLVKARDRQAST